MRICYAVIFVVTTTVSISFLLDQRPSNIMSSLARKFGMSHLLPTESATVIYPTGPHQHHVESDFLHSPYQQKQNNSHPQFSYQNNPENQNHHYLPYQKQKEYQQQKKSLPTSIKMETNGSDNYTAMPSSLNARIGKLVL